MILLYKKHYFIKNNFMAKGPDESNNGEGAKVIELFPLRAQRPLPDIKDTQAAGLTREEELVALMRGHIKPPKDDESLDGNPLGPDMSASRRIIGADRKVIGIGSLREIEEQTLQKVREIINNRKKLPFGTGSSNAAQ